MDPKTGRIVKVKTAEEARQRGLVPITEEELSLVQQMTKDERIEWARGKLEAERAERAKCAIGNRKQRRKLAALDRNHRGSK